MITINPRKALKWLLIAISFLVFANIAGLISIYVFHHDTVFGLVPRFSLDREANIPSWFASMTLFVCSILLGVIAAAKKAEQDRYRRHWFSLSLIFLYLSIDEAGQIHELSAGLLRNLFHAKSFLYFGWVVAAIPLVLILAAIFLKFVMNLPRRIRILFILSGGLYIGGALVMELIDGWYYFKISRHNLTYDLMTTVEEMLEMLGIALFIFSLLSYINLTINKITLCVSEKNEGGPPGHLE